MTTLSFRADDALVQALEREAARVGRSRSDLLSDALRDFLYRSACERDAAIYDEHPLSDDDAGSWPAESWVEDRSGTNWDEVFGT